MIIIIMKEHLILDAYDVSYDRCNADASRIQV